MSDAPDGIRRYFEAVTALQQQVIASQRATLERVADAMTETAARGARIFVFGTGHSHMLAEEGHYRAGGLACVIPILYPALMLHESGQMSSQIERVSGLAATLLTRYAPEAGDLLFVFSNSGVNAVPVEMALEAKARGLRVVAVCSLAYSQVAPLSPVGQRLFEVADFTLDNGGEPGDSLIPLEGSAWRVGPSSTLIGALLWNCLVTEVAFRLHAAGADVPIYVSANMPNAREHNAALMQVWRRRNPHI